MRNKLDVFQVFKKFKALVEAQSGCKIQVLRSDNGKEYTSKMFDQFCEENGVHHQLTVPYTPQQNGVAERKNRSVMEMARCMLVEKGPPNKFWAEAVYTSVYLQNRLSTKAVKDKTPIEVWSGLKPTAKHLKVFGSLCYIHVPDQKRSKLDNKAEKGIFLGYSSQSKGYRVYNIETGKISVSRDVKIDENAQWNWEEAEPQQQSVLLPIVQQNTPTAVPEIQPHVTESSSSNDGPSESSSNSNSSSSSSSPPRGTRPLNEIYERCYMAIVEPNSYVEVAKHPKWIDAMEEEMKMIQKNQTWELVPRPTDKKVIGVKWIYKAKVNPDGSIYKYKARLVAKGFAQECGVDYFETFAPVARHDTIRLLIALAAQKRWKIHQLDIKSAFLNGELEEDIFVEQPEGFQLSSDPDCVCKLKKALYGLKQAPRAWYGRIDGYLCGSGFKRSESEHTLYVKTDSYSNVLIISLYVDDLLITGNNMKEIESFTHDLEKEFEMTNLGEMKYFLGIEIEQKTDSIFISQQKYTTNILKKFKMLNCKRVDTPLAMNTKLSKEDEDQPTNEKEYRSLVGSLLYLTATRPDLMYAASLLSRFMTNPSQTHFVTAKRALRYIR
jgi:hypothetical protein